MRKKKRILHVIYRNTRAYQGMNALPILLSPLPLFATAKACLSRLSSEHREQIKEYLQIYVLLPYLFFYLKIPLKIKLCLVAHNKRGNNHSASKKAQSRCKKFEYGRTSVPLPL